MTEKEGSGTLEVQAVCLSKQRSDEILNRTVRTAKACCDRVRKATGARNIEGKGQGFDQG